MNLTLGNTFPRTWKRFGVQHVVAAGAAAIALSAALTAGLSLSDSLSGGGPAGNAATGRTVSAPAARNNMTYYIVGSLAEAARIEQGIASAAAEAWQTGYQQVAHNGLAQVVIETPEQEMQFQSALMALQQADPHASNVSIVDLRR
jgi:hypothetical protein